jgi:hypothetical protein
LDWVHKKQVAAPAIFFFPAPLASEQFCAHAPGGGGNFRPNFFAISITRGMSLACCGFRSRDVILEKCR